MVVGVGNIQWMASGYSQSEAFADMLVTALVQLKKVQGY